MPRRQRLTHHRAVDIALAAGAHLEDPGAQQVGVGAVGRRVPAHGASAADELFYLPDSEKLSYLMKCLNHLLST